MATGTEATSWNPTHCHICFSKLHMCGHRCIFIITDILLYFCPKTNQHVWAGRRRRVFRLFLLESHESHHDDPILKMTASLDTISFFYRSLEDHTNQISYIGRQQTSSHCPVIVPWINQSCYSTSLLLFP